MLGVKIINLNVKGVFSRGFILIPVATLFFAFSQAFGLMEYFGIYEVSASLFQLLFETISLVSLLIGLLIIFFSISKVEWMFVNPEKEEGGRILPKELYNRLDHKIRFRIATLLYKNIEMSYSEIEDAMNIDRGLLNFHLRKMKGLLRRTKNRTYILSEAGKRSYEKISKLMRPLTSDEGIPLQIFLKRIVAFSIDAAILFLSTGIFFAVDIQTALLTLNLNSLPELTLKYSTIFILALIYFTILEAYKGQTLGKYIVGIRAIKTDGRKLTLLDSAVRNLGKIVMLPLDLIIGLAFYRSKGFIRFFDFYTQCSIEEVNPVNDENVF